MKNAITQIARILALVVLAVSLAATAHGAVPGISGTTFNLTAGPGYLNQPDGHSIYSWGYGCTDAGAADKFVPAVPFAFSPKCPIMQVPGPTLVVTEGQQITIVLTNALPAAAGNTSILFPGLQVTANGGVAGLLTTEAAPGGTVTYQFTASAPGTHPYYSGTQGDVQVEMGLYGAIVVLPATVPANCAGGIHTVDQQVKAHWGEPDFRLTNASGAAGAAYDHPASCYDREYLFQWAEMDPRIHQQAEAQAGLSCPPGAVGCMNIQTEPYHPAYFLINGRSMPDLMDPNYAPDYPNQPYNANPHTHPGELLLLRTIGQGRWQHPFHEHANHVRILARDGNLELAGPSSVCATTGNPNCINYVGGSSSGTPGPALSGLLMFNTDTTPGESFDGIFYFTGRGLNWDPYGHHPATNAAPITSLTINSLSDLSGSGTVSLSEAGTTVTATVTGLGLTIPASLVGQTVTITGAAASGYNGSFTVTSVPSPNSFTYTDSAVLAGADSGTATFSVVTATVSGITLPTSLVGDTMTIANAQDCSATLCNPIAGYNGSFTVTSVTPPYSFTYSATATNLANANNTHGPVGTVTFPVNVGATNANPFPTDPLASLPCTPDAYGYNTGFGPTDYNYSGGIVVSPSPVTAVNFYEWCQDHNKPVQVNPFGDVPAGGPATFPDPDILTNGAWYGGTPYLGPDASVRAFAPACSGTTNANCTPLQPANLQLNPANERGWAFMWHSHNEREITTNNVFPGGMLMMLLVDSREFVIDESL